MRNHISRSHQFHPILSSRLSLLSYKQVVCFKDIFYFMWSVTSYQCVCNTFWILIMQKMARVKCWCQCGASVFWWWWLERRGKQKQQTVCCCLTCSSLNASSGPARGSKRAFWQANTELVNASCLKLKMNDTLLHRVCIMNIKWNTIF